MKCAICGEGVSSLGVEASKTIKVLATKNSKLTACDEAAVCENCLKEETTKLVSVLCREEGVVNCAVCGAKAFRVATDNQHRVSVVIEEQHDTPDGRTIRNTVHNDLKVVCPVCLDKTRAFDKRSLSKVIFEGWSF